VRHFDLWFARILRLTGTALVVGFFISLGLTTLLALDWTPSPQLEQFVVLSIIVGVVCAALGIPLALIGDKISPPDPWLDPWLNPFKGRKRAPANPYEEEAEP